MRRKLSWLTGFIWLVCIVQSSYAAPKPRPWVTQTYQSLNAATTPGMRPSKMVQIDYRSLFEGLDGQAVDTTGGIKGQVSAGGKIKLSVYAYDKNATNGKGLLVYGIQLNATSSIYAGQFWTISRSDLLGGTARSTSIKRLVRGVEMFVDDWAFPGCTISPSVVYGDLNIGTKSPCYGLRRHQPVIIEAEITNATLAKIKVPGIGEMDFSEAFEVTTPYSAVKDYVTIGVHRGLWQDVDAPENTKRSIRRMIEGGYDMLELDLWSTNDDTVIVFHDEGLKKRTLAEGSNEMMNVKNRAWDDIKGFYIKNRFDEEIQSNETKIETLRNILRFVKQEDPAGRIFLNLDRSANDMNMFVLVYNVVREEGMLGRCIFKGRFNPKPDVDGEIAPTVQSFKNAFQTLYTGLTPTQLDNKMRAMHYTPVLFDADKSSTITNDNAYAERIKKYIDDMAGAGIADGFELNYKSYPPNSGPFSNSKDDNTFLLDHWREISTAESIGGTFVDYVHSKHLPVGIFASIPEVCAIPNFDTDGTRMLDSLVSGFVKEDVAKKNKDGTPRIPTYVQKIQPQADYDFRGDWDFYIPAGADYVITDRPDALRAYLKAIGRLKNNP